jgi:hypothetical protein
MHRGSNIVFACTWPLYKGGPPAPWEEFVDCIHKTTSDEIGKTLLPSHFNWAFTQEHICISG